MEWLDEQGLLGVPTAQQLLARLVTGQAHWDALTRALVPVWVHQHGICRQQPARARQAEEGEGQESNLDHEDQWWR